MFDEGMRGIGSEETFQVKDLAELVAASMVTRAEGNGIGQLGQS